MKKHLKNNLRKFSMFVAAFVALCLAAQTSNAQPSAFTFKMDPQQSVLNDQANLENLEDAIAAGTLNGGSPQVQSALAYAEYQQYMSVYNSLCTLVTSAKASQTQPTIAIGNGYEKNNNPASPNYDPIVKAASQVYYPAGNFATYDRDVDPNNIHETSLGWNVTGFKLSLGSTANGYQFGVHPTSNQNTLPMVVPNNTNVTSSLQDNGNTLLVAFGNGGLLPGQMVTMQLQLNQDNASPLTPWPSLTDFFSNDSVLSVIFQDPVTQNVTETMPIQFGNFQTNAAGWQGQLMASQHIDGTVPSFELDGDIIPEPSSAVLGIGSLGWFLLGRRRIA
jgi:hypothetical protein